MVQSENTYDSRPQYVAVADFNQDNRLDLVIANTGIDNIGIRLGYGNGSFTDQILYFTGKGSQPYWVVVKDFNNDDLLDIAVANYGTNNIGILLGDDNGSFASYRTYSLGASRPLSLAIGDFNNDSQWDIVVVNNATFDMLILYGGVDASFLMGKPYFMGYDSMPCSIAVADFNKDNRSDIAVVNYGTSELVIFLSNENDTFTIDKYSTGTNSHPSSLTVDYIDSDDYLDIAVANSATHNIGVFSGHPDGKFPLLQTYATSSNSYLQFIVAGQFNNENTRDLAVVDSSENYLIIFKGDGNGSFSIATNQQIGHGSRPYSIAVADFDNNNQSDMVVVNNGISNILLLSLYTFQTTTDQRSYSTGRYSFPVFVTVGDVNNDKHLDIIVANRFAGNIGTFIGLGNGSFKSQAIVPWRTNLVSPESHATGDFNKDKLLDLAVVLSSGEIDIYFGQRNGSFKFGGSYSLSHSSAISITIGDFNNDNNLDLATVNYGASNLAVFLGSKNGTFSAATYYTLNPINFFPECIAVGDFNNDDFPDLVFSSTFLMITIMFGYGNGTFQNAPIVNLNSFNPTWIVVADLNNDGQHDIIVTKSPSIVGVFIGNGDGTFQDLYEYSPYDGNRLTNAVLGNFDKNNITDIAVADSIDCSVTIFLRDLNENLTKQSNILLENDYSPNDMAAGDFNNDTETDLVLISTRNDVMIILLLKYQAIFSNQTSYNQGSGRHPYSITTGDFDNDHQLDIAVVNSGRDNVEILTDHRNGTFRKRIIYPTGYNSYPRHLLTADFDKNHQLDIAVVNYRKDNLMIILNPGNETATRSFEYSTGNRSFPNALTAGDFNKDGWTDVVITNSNADNVSVFLGFDYATFTINNTFNINCASPLVPVPPPNYVAVVDFNKDSLWDLVIACQAVGTINILLGNGDGTFRNQSSHLLGISGYDTTFFIGDFNSDNQLDLGVADLFYGRIHVLLGNGDGTFAHIEQSMRYSINYFIAVGEFNHDGRQDLVVVKRSEKTIETFLGYGNGSFAEHVFYPMPEGFTEVLIVDDLNNDHISDLVVANDLEGSIGILLGIGDGTFENVTIYPTGDDSAPSSAAIGDFNKDNCTDIAALNTDKKKVGIFFGYGNGTFSSQMVIVIKMNSILTAMIVEDLNNDTVLDIVITDFVDGNSNINVFYGLGGMRFLPPKIFYLEYKKQVSSMVAKDFNNDGRIDFLLRIQNEKKVIIMLQGSNEPFGSSITFSTGTGSVPSAIALSDFNNDDQLDIVVVNSRSSDIRILFGDGNGNFLSWKTYSTGLNTLPSYIAVGDVDGDQQHDILVTNSNTNEIGIFYSYGNGTFAVVQTFSTGYGSEPSSVCIADLNKDNLMDIVVANTGINTVVVFYGTGNRLLLNSERYSFDYNYRPRAIAIGDLDNDGWLDIAVANYESGSVDVLFHTC